MNPRFFIIPLVLLVGIGVVHAASCTVTVSSTNTQQLLSEIPSINAQLQSCPLQLARFTLSNGANVVDVQMNDGSTESMTVTVQNRQVTGVTRGTSACTKKIVTTENAVNSILSSSNKGGAALFLFANKGLRVQGCTVWRKFTTFFTQPIGRFVAKRIAPPSLPTALKQPGAVCQHGGECTTGYCVADAPGSRTFRCSCEQLTYAASGGVCNPSTAGAPNPGARGKPANCDDTYVPGHQGYTQNKATWDDYTARTDGVCQSQYGRGAPSPCAYSVQLSVSGNPYYLCWYNN